MDATSEHLHRPDNPEVRHERSDVSVRSIFLFGVGLLIAAVVIHLLMWWLFDYFAARAERVDRPFPTSVVRGTTKSVPPEPHLQVVPRQDLQEMRATEDAVLNSYGWVDQQTRIVRIPVERAMQVLAERGLPVQPQSETPEGRQFQEPEKQ